LYFTIDEKNNSVDLTDKGIELITGAGEDPHFFVIPDVGATVAEIEKLGLKCRRKIASQGSIDERVLFENRAYSLDSAIVESLYVV
jgi:preprotein translocase subunit SecA